MERINFEYANIFDLAKRFVEIALCPEIEKEMFTIDDISNINDFDKTINRQAKRIFESNAARTDRYTGKYRNYQEVYTTTLVGKASEIWLKEKFKDRLEFMKEDAHDDSLYNDLRITKGKNSGKVLEVKTVVFSQNLSNPGDRTKFDMKSKTFISNRGTHTWDDFEKYEINRSNRFPTLNVTKLKDMGVYGVMVLHDKIYEKLKRVNKEGFYKADFVSVFVCNDFTNPSKWWYLSSLELPKK